MVVVLGLDGNELTTSIANLGMDEIAALMAASDVVLPSARRIYAYASVGVDVVICCEVVG